MSETSLPENMFGTTKVGRVLIAMDAIRDEPDIVLEIMSKMIPIKVDFNVKAQVMDYLAISEYFDELKTKELIPIYTTQVFNDGSVEFKRTTYKRVVDEAVKDEIMKMIVENDVNMTDFKAFVKKYTNATDEDFNKYDETLLEALKIYISRRDEPAL